MKKIIVFFLMCIFLLVLAIFGLLVQAGLFYKPVVIEAKSGPYTIAYLENIGDYAQVGKLQMQIINSIKNDFGIDSVRGIGVYLDNPAKVEKTKLRSELGFIIEGNNIKKLKQLKTKFKIKTIKKQICLISEHPFINPLSIIVGMIKIYPMFNKYMAGKPNTYTYSVEIYDMSGKKVIYLMM